MCWAILGWLQFTVFFRCKFRSLECLHKAYIGRAGWWVCATFGPIPNFWDVWSFCKPSFAPDSYKASPCTSLNGSCPTFKQWGCTYIYEVWSALKCQFVLDHQTTHHFFWLRFSTFLTHTFLLLALFQTKNAYTYITSNWNYFYCGVKSGSTWNIPVIPLRWICCDWHYFGCLGRCSAAGTTCQDDDQGLWERARCGARWLDELNVAINSWHWTWYKSTYIISYNL